MGDTSPEGAKSKRTRKQWPEAVWERGSDGKMKRVELSKLNRDLYHLMFGPQTVLPMAQKMPKKKKNIFRYLLLSVYLESLFVLLHRN